MKRRTNTSEVVNSILKGLVMAGMVGSVIVAPNLIQVGDKALSYLNKRSKKLKDARALYYMKRKGLVDYREVKNGSYRLEITEAGRHRQYLSALSNIKVPTPAKWDKKWRLVMFDIPENQRKSRSSLSQKLNQMNFYQLQKSVWLYPYPCEKEIAVIKEAYQIPDDFIILANVEIIDSEKVLKKHYSL